MFPSPTRPEGLNLHSAFDSCCVMPEARPRPVLRSLDKAADDRVAMHITQLLDVLVFGEDVEVVVTGLPERPLAPPQRDGKFDRLDGPVKTGAVRFID